VQPFQFYNPTRVLFGTGKIAALPQYLPPHARVLFTFDEDAVMHNDVHRQVMQALSGLTVIQFGGIRPNPDYDYLMQALPLIQAHQLNVIVSAGGGSVIDGSKFIAAAACTSGNPWDLSAQPFLVKTALPHLCIPTLPGAGSEMNCWGVISRRSLALKRDFSGNALFPQLSILDPTVTLTLPWQHLQNGMIDTFSHVIEQYITTPYDTPLQNRQAEALLLTIIEAAQAIMHNPDDLHARGHLMWAACLSLNDHLQAGMQPDFAAHRISHVFTALYQLSHGQSMALLLPATLSALKEMKRTKLIRYAHYVWHLTSKDEDQLIEGAIAATRDFFTQLGVSLNPADHGLSPEIIPEVLAHIDAEYTYPLGECHPIYHAEVKAILEHLF
jgi:NADP-dependent alcohol dehydrogenase